MSRRQAMAVANTKSALEEGELQHCLPQIYKALLTASCLSCPSDPIQFLKNTLTAFQGHDNLQDVDWHMFVADVEHRAVASSLARRTVCPVSMDQDDDMVSFSLFEKAYSCYRKNLASSCLRKWKRFTMQRKRDAIELALKMDLTKKHYERKCQQVALTKWSNWTKIQKTTRAVAEKKLERLVITARLKRFVAAWRILAKESKRTKEYFKSLEASKKIDWTMEGCDGFSVIPSRLSLKIFQYLELRDWLNCAEVNCTWRSIIQSSTLWSQINFSVEKDWITDSTVKQILQNYRPYVIHLNLRGCTSLKWPSLKCISECRNLQELNVSECFSVTDVMIQKIVEGCPCLLYLNLSCTLITNKTLHELSRNCLNLQYLSLAYCYRFTDKGFMYLTTGKGCHNLFHLNLSGCTQMTVDGFRYISAGCPSLKEIVINDMPTLSDSCVLALIARCRCLSAISLLDAPHLSDVAFKAIAEVAKLKTFSTEGNNQLTDISWIALCRSSQGLRRIHAAECPRMTDASLKSAAALKNLQHLDISLCSKVSDTGIKYLTEGFSTTKLRELNVSHCCHITDTSVRRIAQRLCKLYHLNLSYCERLTDMSLQWLSGSSVCSLDIGGCNIQDEGLAAFERIGLKKLVLAECVYITDIGIEKLCKNVRGLEHVDVSHCVALSDPAIRSISFYCRGLVILRMSGCPKMTDMAVQYLTSGSQYLRELDVSGCVLLTDRSLRHLEKICPPFCSITMAFCSSISKVAALKLQPRVKYWEHSNDDPPYWFGYSSIGQTHAVTRSTRTDDTWEVAERHSAMT
ncbi:dynein regulatory complex subunit 6 isoform X1 [Larimichthys crocea]|uniref:dynein regulatory complex subunit 6 isoform X1 n=2 Tax=Larimichthys crocea TaxID=215358 RepID=UPI000F5F8806|nr:dynein regulatory complex subunit 6 isoform X1 [Larimichthys crocea]XP_027128700.1 dynein regulatory complex subunit 6 isoform X1 [Larimichthys crocea]XP_027128701.1 dynein regulatory complex subunit 6 isoform X1 [Larimichthys crocea]